LKDKDCMTRSKRSGGATSETTLTVILIRWRDDELHHDISDDDDQQRQPLADTFVPLSFSLSSRRRLTGSLQRLFEFLQCNRTSVLLASGLALIRTSFAYSLSLSNDLSQKQVSTAVASIASSTHSLQRDGVCIVRNVLTKPEIAEWKAKVEKQCSGPGSKAKVALGRHHAVLWRDVDDPPLLRLREELVRAAMV
jgi:hypothetical protein